MSIGDMAKASHNAETGFEVELYVYDLSKGLARRITPMLLGKQLPGVWHTSIVVRGREYFFGSTGIDCCRAGKTILEEPDQVISLGRSELPYSVFLAYIDELAESSYKGSTYNLLRHNCNNFSQDVAMFLTGKSIPREILELPDEFLRTPLGNTLIPLFENLSVAVDKAPDHGSGSGRAPRDSSRPDHRSERTSTSPDRSDRQRPRAAYKRAEERTSESAEGGSDEESEDQPGTTRHPKRGSDTQPILYPRIDGVAALKELERHLERVITDRERSALTQLRDYLVKGHGAFALGQQQFDLFDKVLTHRDGSPAVRLMLLRVLQAVALVKDVVLFLHQDRKNHCIMSYVYRIAKLPSDEQDEVLKLLCNLCKHTSSCDWLLYASEWNEELSGLLCSNAKATIHAVVHGLLCGRRLAGELSAALVFNLSAREVFEDTATELTAAIIQYLEGEVEEEQAYRCFTALHRFLRCRYNDVSALIKTLGPHLQKFSGASQRVKKLVDEVGQKVSASVRRH
ncbi:uncharacterized protein LOC144109401 [Amblyomma americanum]|uniref:PPPDE domain-containing protein n=1 Tax=Amblyomma americanum TaxID=6943 RepID=A0AAQ4DLT2_AMBAM